MDRIQTLDQAIGEIRNIYIRLEVIADFQENNYLKKLTLRLRAAHDSLLTVYHELEGEIAHGKSKA